MAGDQDLVVEMRAGGTAGAADPADQVALTHQASGAQPGRVALEVSVAGRDAAPVLDAHIVAVSTKALGSDHQAVTGRAYRRPGRRRPVDPRMHLPRLEDRVVANTEARAETPPIDRLEHQSISAHSDVAARRSGLAGARGAPCADHEQSR